MIILIIMMIIIIYNDYYHYLYYCFYSPIYHNSMQALRITLPARLKGYLVLLTAGPRKGQCWALIKILGASQSYALNTCNTNDTIQLQVE